MTQVHILEKGIPSFGNVIA